MSVSSAGQGQHGPQLHQGAGAGQPQRDQHAPGRRPGTWKPPSPGWSLPVRAARLRAAGRGGAAVASASSVPSTTRLAEAGAGFAGLRLCDGGRGRPAGPLSAWPVPPDVPVSPPAAVPLSGAEESSLVPPPARSGPLGAGPTRTRTVSATPDPVLGRGQAYGDVVAALLAERVRDLGPRRRRDPSPKVQL